MDNSSIAPGVFIALRATLRNRDAIALKDSEVDEVLAALVSHSPSQREAEAAAQLLHARRKASEAQANFDALLGS